MATTPNPFRALGLPERPDLTDEQVRAAWRNIAAATHPDRPDADLADQSGDGPATAPIPVISGDELPPEPPWQLLRALTQVPTRIRSGRPLRLAIRGVIAAVLALIVLQLIPGAPAAPADVFGLILWFVLTGRKDLAPPPER